MESVAEIKGHPSDELGGGVYISGGQEDEVVEDGREGYEEEEEEEEEEVEEESEPEEESESEAGEDYSRGRGCHVGVSLGGESEDEGYKGEYEEEGEEEEYDGEEGDYDGAVECYYGEGEEPVDGDRMLWACGICNITVNIFARDDHIVSRSHIRAARKQAGEVAAPPSRSTYLPMWRCTLCDDEMSVFLREEHMIGKEHLRMARKRRSEIGARSMAPDALPMPAQQYEHGGGNPYDGTIESCMVSFPDIPESSSSSSSSNSSNSYKLRKTFYCITCAAEFDLSTEELHLGDIEIWDCTLCSKTMHPAAQEMHLQSQRHMAMRSVYEAQPVDLYCEVCRKSYAPAEKESHLAGMEHQQTAARIELEQRYLKRLQELSYTAELSGPPPGALPHTAGKGEAPPTAQDKKGGDPWVCDLCNEPLLGMLLSGHRTWHCAFADRSSISIRAPQDPNSFFCGICNKRLALADKDGHLQGRKHQAKAAKKEKGKANAKAPAKAGAAHTPAKKKAAMPVDAQYCEVCNKYKSAAGMAGHMKSKKHKKKAAAKQQAAKQQVTGPSTQVGQPLPATRVLSQPAARVLPPPVPRAQAPTPVVSNSPYVTISGDKFHCKACKRNRQLVGMEAHLKSRSHRKKAAEAAW